MANESTRRQQLKEVLQTTTDEAACDVVLGQLDEYVAAQLNGRDPFPLFPHIAVHLDGCLLCSAAYGRLYRLALAEQNEALPIVQNPRQPNLSFLPPVLSLADKLRTAVEKLHNGWRFHLSADLLPLLQPQPALMPVRAPTTDDRYAELLLSLEPDESLQTDLPFKLLVCRDAQSPADCLVEVWVQPHGRAWPHLAGFTVTLQLPDQTHQQSTNPWGVASFAQIPVKHLSNLTIVITG